MASKKIGIDISQVVYGTGASVYTAELVKHLVQIDNQNSYFLFAGVLRRRSQLYTFLNQFPLTSKVSKSIYPFPPTLLDLLWNRLHIVPISVFTGAVDLFHSSDWTQPPGDMLKVTTIHDLAPILFPHETHPKIRQVHERRLKWVKKEVDGIIVPSMATCKDLVEHGFDRAKIEIIPEAPVTHVEKINKENVDLIKTKFGLKEPYLLSVGLNPRKNTSRIIKAFEQVYKKEGLNQLVIVGTKNIEMPYSKNVITTGHISQSELTVLYRNAQALVYPSLYEGFGLPILEAFEAGCPVVTSKISSMPEVAGEAAVLVDPLQVEDIAKGIQYALKNKIQLAQKGLLQLNKYSWNKTARQTLNFYEKFIS